MKEYQISDKQGNYATILPEKGATVIKLLSNGVDVFYQDMDNINSPERPRCGIPFLFPVFGRTPEGSIYPMEIHGFGHTSEWKVLSYTEDKIKVELLANEDTKKVYPFDFRVELVFSICDGRLTIQQEYENTGDKDMPFAFGFHPYFSVNAAKTVTTVDAELEMDMQTGQPKPFDGRPVQLRIPEGAPESGAFFVQVKNGVMLREEDKEIYMDFDENFQRLVFWTLTEKNFLCVEPINFTADEVAKGNCYILAPGEKKKAEVAFYGRIK